MKKLFLLTAGIIFTFIAAARQPIDSGFTVKINASGFNKTTTMYLAYQVAGKKIIDSAVQNKGVYLFTGKVDRPQNATLVSDPDQLGLSQLIRKTVTAGKVDLLQFYIYPGEISLKTNGNIADADFIGSSINTENKQLQQQGLKEIKDKQIDVSNQIRAEKNPQAAQGLIKQLDSLNALRKPILKQFIRENPNSLIALFSLEDYAGSPPNPAVIEPMFMKLSAKVRNSVLGKTYYKFLMDQKNLVAGVRAPEFVQNDTAGKPVSLSQFRGKYVLLDFWASWCGPCRQDNPGLVQIYHNFKNRNFTILGISLDAADGRSAWIQAIKDDHLDWIQVSDLRHWDNRVAKQYSVPAIPQNFLIDPSGIIIAKGLNHEQLKKKLEEVLPVK